VDGSTLNFVRAGTMSSDVPLRLCEPLAPGGGVRGVKKLKKWGTATISIFLSVAKCGSICRAHSGVEPSGSAKAILRRGPKSSKKIQIFQYFQTLRPYISETIKNSGI